MQNISYFSGNIGNWQMSGFCQKLTANVTWWDIDDPFWKFLLERLSKQLSWFPRVRFVTSLAGACLQYLKLSVRMTQLWQWHIDYCHFQSYRVIHSTTSPSHGLKRKISVVDNLYIFTGRCLRLAVCKCPNQNPY